MWIIVSKKEIWVGTSQVLTRSLTSAVGYLVWVVAQPKEGKLLQREQSRPGLLCMPAYDFNYNNHSQSKWFCFNEKPLSSSLQRLILWAAQCQLLPLRTASLSAEPWTFHLKECDLSDSLTSVSTHKNSTHIHARIHESEDSKRFFEGVLER